MLDAHQLEKPPIFISEADCERLAELSERSKAAGAALLRRELDRATLVRAGAAAPAFVRLGSKVEFEDLISGRTRTVTLVLPEEADMDHDRLSVLAPAGAALFGLTVGDHFSWTTDGGRPRVLAVRRIGASK